MRGRMTWHRNDGYGEMKGEGGYPRPELLRASVVGMSGNTGARGKPEGSGNPPPDRS